MRSWNCKIVYWHDQEEETLKRKNFSSEIISSESANIFIVYVIPLLLFFVPHYQFENTARQVFE